MVVKKSRPEISFESIIENLPGHLYWKDKDGVFLGCNNQQAKDAGLSSPSEIIGKTDFDMPWKKLAKSIRENDIKVMQIGAPITIEEKSYLSTKVPLFNEQGEIIGILGTSVQATQYKKAIELNKSILDEIIAAMPGHVYWKNRDCILQGCNDQQAKDAGLKSHDDIIGKSAYDIIAPNQPEGARRKQAAITDNIDIKVMETNKQQTIEEFVVLSNKTKATYLSKKVPLHDDENNVVGLVGISFDITERKQMEAALKKAKEKAEESSKLKSQFMMNMQHDLRTPASGVAKMLEILAKDEGDDDKKKILNQIAHSSRTLLNVLNAMLEFDSIEHGTFPLLSERFSLRDIIDDVIALEAPTAALKHIELRSCVDKKIPLLMVGDPFRTQRVLINLLTNAIKFTDKGHVEISGKLLKQIDKQNIVIQIIVKDTGIGIPKDKQKVVFQRFTQLDGSSKGVFSGMGLGLDMVKQFVDEMQGSIDVKSNANKGTTFLCSIPFRLLTQKEIAKSHEHLRQLSQLSPSVNQSKQKKIHVLLVEDDEVARLVGKSLLKDEFKTQLDIAMTGQDAINQAMKSKPLYDLIFMDVGLPDGKGYDFAQKIHMLSREAAKIPIIAITAHNNKATKAACKKNGLQDYLTKPLSADKVNGVFQRWLSKTSPYPHPKSTDTKILDLELGTQLAGGKLEEAKKLLRMLVSALPEYRQQIENSFQARDNDDLRKTIHKLHGSACYCGTPTLKTAAKKLEEAIGNKKKNIGVLYKKLLLEITTVIKAFKEL